VKTLRARREDDQGVSLIVALVFVAAVSLIVGGLLSYASTAIRNVKVSTQQTTLTYDGDGAIKAAIGAIRQSTFYNRTTDTECSSPLAYPGISGAGSVKVTCSALAGTGAQSSTITLSPGANIPGTALITLGTNGWEEGLRKQKNNVLRVQGGLAVQSTLRQDSGSSCAATPQPPVANCTEIHVTGGAANVGGNCVPSPVSGSTVSIYATGGVTCNAGTPATDPAYTLPSGALTYQPVPACPSSPTNTKTVVFPGGYYNDASTLSDLMRTCGARAFLFPDPVYYFDFKNDETTALPAGATAANRHLWDVSQDVTVIAGKPSGWNPSVLSATPPTVPGACVRPNDDPDNHGTAFIFGGDSRLSMTRGKFEICAQYEATQPPIAIGGVVGSTGDPASTASDTWSTTQTNPGGMDAAFTPTPTTSILQTSDNVLTTASLNVPKNQQRTVGLNLSDFRPATPIPAGSILKVAELRIRHRVTLGGSVAPSVNSATAAISSSSGGATLATPDVTPPSSFPSGTGATVYDIRSSLQARILAGTLPGLNIQYRITVRGGSSAGTAAVDVDSVQLHLEYIPPTLRGQAATLPNGASCVAAVTNFADSCPLVKSSGSNTSIHFQGMTYTPRARLEIFLNDSSQQVFRWGLVVRSLYLDTTASFSYDDNVIEVPHEQFGKKPALTYFTAYVCAPGMSATCATTSPPGAAWRLEGRAIATFADPILGRSRPVNIVAWESAE
jgi:hypothetical protein